MENEMKRYNFGGFAFGDNGLFQLTINTKSYAEFGTSSTIELGLELTPTELQELITVLLTKNAKVNN